MFNNQKSSSKLRIYTKEKIQAAANECSDVNTFMKKYLKMYKAAQRFGLLEEVCSHMTKRKNKNGYWTFELAQNCAIQCNTIKEFRFKFHGAYKYALRKRIINQICSHMTQAGIVSKPEKELLLAIQEVFPEARKLRDRKVVITGKPHIKGFDIDVLFGNLGIEFDGNFWHTPEGLRKGRERWPQEDILNYHQIKDGWFLSKGIKILHVKESDWRLNKEDCIRKCLDFLSFGKTIKAA